jgi:hypothetical protein
MVELVIKIPGKEFGIDINDKFQDFFSRLKVEIKEHLITNTNIMYGAYELETIDMFLKAFNNGTLLPKGHGRLIDENTIEIPFDICDGEEAFDYVVNAPTVLEADTESEEIRR